MKKFYRVVLGLLCLCFSALAQNTEIKVTYPETACLGAPQKIQVSLNGEFRADNKFTVQVRSGDNSPVLTELPAQLIDKKIEVFYADSSLSNYRLLQLRVVASSPKTESNWSNFRLNTKGTIHLGLADSDTINAGDDLRIRFETFSSSSVQVTLNNDTEFSISSPAEGLFSTYHNLGTDKTDPFYILKATNICGPMKVSGEVKAVINPISLRTVSVYPASVCEDSEVRVSFSTLIQALPAQAKFRIRFAVYDGDLANLKIAEAPAELKDNVLVARFPKSLNIIRRSQFKIKILTDNPAIAGAYTGLDYNVYPKAKAEFTTQSTTINAGDKITIGLAFTGLPPFSAELQDGSTISTSFSSNMSADLRPEKTTSYTVKSLTSGCGQIISPSSQTLLATVRAGIFLETDGGTEILCAGSLARVKMFINSEQSSGANFTINAVIAGKNVYTFPAKKTGDYLEFTIPELPKGTDLTLSYDRINSLFISSQNPDFRSNNSTKYIIQSLPEMIVQEGAILNYKTPRITSLGYLLRGNGPFVIEDEAGITYNIEGYQSWSPNFFLRKTTDFKLKSISNSCFKNENIPVVRLTLDTTGTPPGIYMDPLPSTVCRQDSIEITFTKTGTFNTGNTFKVEGYTDCCSFQTLATMNRDGKYKVKVPSSQSQSPYLSLRVTSTNPQLYSETYQVLMQVKPGNFSITPKGTASLPADFSEDTSIDLALSNNGGGSLTSFVYTDGVTETTKITKLNDYNAKLFPILGKTTAYTIKTATNQCGTVPVNLTTYIRRIPYRIVINGGENGSLLSFCPGGTLSLPFVTIGGKSVNGKFSLLIAKEQTDEYTTLVKDETTRQFNTTIPANFTAGNYQLKVESSDGSVSNIIAVKIGAAPGAVISTDQPQPIILQPGGVFPAKISFTGSSPWTVVYENSTKVTTTSNPETREIYYTKAQDFSLLAVYNSCGYGTVSGKVSIKVTPRLSLFSDNQQVCDGSSLTVRYQLQGDAAIGNDYIRFELVDKQNGKITPLDSTRNVSGSILLNIPSSLPDHPYQIRGTLKSSGLTSLLNMEIKTKADVSLSGNTTINKGESAQLLIKSNKSTNEAINYQLSNGAGGTFYGGSANRDSYIQVTPDKTTTYTLTSVSNVCGTGKTSGSATVEVNPSGERTVTVSGWEPATASGYCLGDKILVHYKQSGNFSSGNRMTIQFSDTTGKNFRSVTTTGTSSPLETVITNDFFPGKKYRMRVVASDAGVSSGAFAYHFSTAQKPKVRFASETALLDGINNPKIIVLLEGGSYWTYQYGTDLTTESKTTSQPADTLMLSRVLPNQYYRLLSVSNECGKGTIESPSIIRIEVITAEPSPVLQEIVVAPNPADDYLRIQFGYPVSRNIRLISLTGIPVLKKTSRESEEQLDIRNLPIGIYILEVENGGKKATYKVIKR